jgi:hypothetical protein
MWKGPVRVWKGKGKSSIRVWKERERKRGINSIMEEQEKKKKIIKSYVEGLVRVGK